MMPLITRRSSTRRAPGWFLGNNGAIAAQARPKANILPLLTPTADHRQSETS